MFCNYCSKICVEKHQCGKESIEDKVYDLVKEKNLIDLIFSYKRDLEYETDEFKIGRFDFIETYSNMKNLKVINNFDNKLKIEYPHSRTIVTRFQFDEQLIKKQEIKLKMDIKLKNIISLKSKDYEYIKEYFLKTIDVPLFNVLRQIKRKKCVKDMQKIFKTEMERHFKHLLEIHQTDIFLF